MEPPSPSSSSPLLQRYRRDRRNLLDHIITSSGLITEVRTVSGTTSTVPDVDLDELSVDYVIHCANSGGVLDVSKATKMHTEEAMKPLMMHSQKGGFYFLLSDAESAGSPPRRTPPSVEVNHAYSDSSPSDLPDSLIVEKLSISGGKNIHTIPPSVTSSKKASILSLGLPALKTGLSDDDLRESAYEMSLACMAFSGVTIYSSEDQKKDKGSRLLSALKNKKDRRHIQPQCAESQIEQVDIVRVQMQISESMDECIRQRLMQFVTRKTSGQIDIPQITLELLNSLSISDLLNARSYVHWRKRQVNILEEVFSSLNSMRPETQGIETLLLKIRYLKEWDVGTSPVDHSELLAMRRTASKLLFLPPHFDIQGETCYWTACYHLNIRLYEKLLFGMFDTLEEGQLIEESKEFLNLIKLTWSTLGITQKIHEALYGWVLFQQFVRTEEVILLDYAILQVHEVLSANYSDKNEELYLSTLICTIPCNGVDTRLSLLQAIFWSVDTWCENKLQDYHLHFGQKPSFFRRVVTMGLAIGNYKSGKWENCKEKNVDTADEFVATKVRNYVERSVEAAYRRVADTGDVKCKVERKHPLAVLANELRLIIEREITIFNPVLSDWDPDSGMVAAMLLHRLYGDKLKPFLEGVSSLSEDVRSVLSAADMLEHDLTQACPQRSHCINNFDRYQIREICGPIILDWLISQHLRILEWTGRAFDLEVWEPLSNQQKQAASAVEVFRIIEQTVDHFFGLSLPVDISHLQALLSIIFHTLDGYLHKLVSQLVEKYHLYPASPPLTRYKETVFPIIKKKMVECVLLEDGVKDKLNNLTVAKLCVRLNTLQYIKKQIDLLEDGIKKSWRSVSRSQSNRCADEPPGTSGSLYSSGESVDELFVATFDSIRNFVADAIRKICDLSGTRVIFWDLRDAFLFKLYHGTVEGARLENIIPHFDSVLNRICSLIDDTLRDLLVTSICRASLEGYVWVLLDGGPSRAFSDSDFSLMEDDLNVLKDLFVADGEGLPRTLVEVEASFAHKILGLFSLQTESLIQMLMAASERVRMEMGSSMLGQRRLEDANTIIRVLCHKKDKEASNFLKIHYHLPASSEYDDTTSKDSDSKDSSSKSVAGSEFLRSASYRLGETGHSSFKSIKKKFHAVQGGSFRWS